MVVFDKRMLWVPIGQHNLSLVTRIGKGLCLKIGKSTGCPKKPDYQHIAYILHLKE